MVDINYDNEIDALLIKFGQGPYDGSEEVMNGISLDYDLEGNVLSVEVLNVNKQSIGSMNKIPDYLSKDQGSMYRELFICKIPC